VISLSAPTYDPAGVLPLRIRAKNAYQGTRRGTVTATLDGGVSVYDAGYSVADKTLAATLTNPHRAQLVTLEYLIAYYSELILCCETGAYAVRVGFAASASVVTLSLRLLRRLD
jgi:hypothetical protein